MTDRPDVSVVMAAYNGEFMLAQTVKSVLWQEGVSLELIVVDDGSTDRTGAMLETYAVEDPRVRIIHQENQGLTRALSRGCAVARGECVARQDVGDVSLPGRLKKQLGRLAEVPEAALVSCGTRFVGPEGEHLYDVIQDEAVAGNALRTLDARLRGPSHHGCVVFRRAAYWGVGGYRREFYFAQDLDLWMRMTEIGRHVVFPEILYQATIGLDSISSRYRREQVALTRLILGAARLRRAGAGEEPILKRAAAIRPSPGHGGGRFQRSRAMYFIGSCLRRHGEDGAREYFRRAIRENPLHLRSWFRVLFSDRKV